MLRVKDVNRLEVFGYKLRSKDYPDFTNFYFKTLRDGGIIGIYEKTGIIGVSGGYSGESMAVPEELFELFAANLVERVSD